MFLFIKTHFVSNKLGHSPDLSCFVTIETMKFYRRPDRYTVWNDQYGFKI